MIPLALLTTGQTVGLIIGIIAALILLIIIIRSFIIVPQAHAVIVERLGKYNRTLTPGLHVVIPFIEKRSFLISKKEQVLDFKPQPVITKDNVTMQIDTVVYFHITDTKLYLYGVESPLIAMENLTATTLRNIIGDLELDQTLTSRDTINAQMREILDLATDSWGIKVTRVELKNILPPRDIQEAMEKQMRAEREKREAILRAQGTKQAAILEAEGEKESAILRAEAKKIEAIKIAEGEAEAIIRKYEAQAEGIRLISEAQPTEEYLTLQGFLALEKVANGQATKIIIPSEIQNITGLLASLKAAIEDDKKDKQ
jgi:regulator of protease activity HflC (stomatin/prohibitin superfamily)